MVPIGTGALPATAGLLDGRPAGARLDRHGPGQRRHRPGAFHRDYRALFRDQRLDVP